MICIYFVLIWTLSLCNLCNIGLENKVIIITFYCTWPRFLMRSDLWSFIKLIISISFSSSVFPPIPDMFITSWHLPFFLRFPICLSRLYIFRFSSDSRYVYHVFTSSAFPSVNLWVCKIWISHDIAEILQKLVLSINQSINQSIN